jgi:transcriptional regulator with XRE-family HTH domain
MKSGADDKMPRRVRLMLANIGSNIQIARKKRRMTIKETAAAASISVDTVRRAERGDPGITLGVLAMVLLALGEHRRLENFLDVATDDFGLLKGISELPKRVRRRRGEPEGL